MIHHKTNNPGNDSLICSNFVSRLAGFLSSAVITFMVLVYTFHYGLEFERNIQICVVLIFTFWILMLVRAKGVKEYQKGQWIYITVVLLLIAIYLAQTVWGSGLLTLDTIGAIGAEQNGIHRDTLFQVAIAHGIRYYGHSSFLINSAVFLIIILEAMQSLQGFLL